MSIWYRKLILKSQDQMWNSFNPPTIFIFFYDLQISNCGGKVSKPQTAVAAANDHIEKVLCDKSKEKLRLT